MVRRPKQGLPNAFKFASLTMLERKCTRIIRSARGLSEHLGHIEPIPAEAEDFDVLYVPTASVFPPPAHIHLGVLLDVLDCSGRELRILERYDRRLECRYHKSGKLATETEQRRVRVLLKALYAKAALKMLHLACKAHHLDHAARQKAISLKEAV